LPINKNEFLSDLVKKLLTNLDTCRLILCMRGNMIERYTPEFSKKDIIKEMSNLPIDRTGLDYGTIYISSEECHHGPRIKFYRGKPGKDQLSASITISKNPEVIEDAIKLKSSEVGKLFKFVIINKKKLLYMWYHGSEMMTDTWDRYKNALKKVK
jgi:hypothetical protein